LGIKYELNDFFLDLKDFLLDIKRYFNENSSTIHKARNELKVIRYNDIDTVVKSFKVPNIINQIVYAYFRNSKAKKSYLNAVKLQSLGINTPNPIGYIEFYENLLFKESFFIAQKYEYDFTIREPLRNADFKNRESLIKQFVAFTFNLHKNNVYHKDYSAGNILVKQISDDIYEFAIVDINRMEFKHIDIALGLDNFAKLWLDDTNLELIATTYAELAHIPSAEAISLLKQSDKKLKSFVQFKNKARGK
jgi:tRNA A-37 threonylcarbamoyl transferase component Bud32